MKKILLTLLTCVLLPSGLRAAEAAEDDWRFGVTVPLWAPRVDGNATVRGRNADVGISFDKLKDHLDASYSLALEARKGKFGMYGDFGYMKFSGDDTTGRGGRIDADLKFLVADAGVSYLLVKTGEKHPFILEGILGVRYWYTDTDIKVRGPRGNFLLNGGESRNLEDPIIGVRGSQYVTEKLHFDFQGDIGGFGFGQHQADLDWSAGGMASYDFAKWFTFSAGYKALAVDKTEGHGTQKNGLDLIFHGVALAAKFKF